MGNDSDFYLKYHERRSNKNYRRAEFWLLISSLGIVITSLPYILFLWYESVYLSWTLVIIGIITMSVGLSLFFYYIKNYYEDISKKELDKVDEFVRDWEKKQRFKGR